jgi:cytochrome P450
MENRLMTDDTMTSDAGVYYDPYDFEIDNDPYPIWRRLREEAPLYYNAKHDFYALSRFQDVEQGLTDWKTYSSAKGMLLEIIKAVLEYGVELPPGNILFEDPPVHDVHRGILSRVFSPKRMLAIEPKVREFCAHTLDPLVGSSGFDFITDLGAQMPMRTIGMLLGIPDSDQEAIRQAIDESLALADGDPPKVPIDALAHAETLYGEYIDWRAKNPSDDLMTQMLEAEFEDEHGELRRLTRTEILVYVSNIASAGNETTTRLIGWTGKVLAEHPDQLRAVAADRSLVPKVIEEVLRYEAPSPVQARYVTQDVDWYGETVPEGSVMLMLNGSANRDDRKVERGDSFDINRKSDHHLSFGFGLHFCLGAALARMEGRVALDEVLQRWPQWEVDYPNAVQARTSTVRGWTRLPVRVEG